MVDTITSIKANRKVTYLINYNTATNVYVSATVREIFEGDTSNFDTEANIELVIEMENGELLIISEL